MSEQEMRRAIDRAFWYRRLPIVGPWLMRRVNLGLSLNPWRVLTVRWRRPVVMMWEGSFGIVVRYESAKESEVRLDV